MYIFLNRYLVGRQKKIPPTKRHCIGKKMVAVSGEPVSGVSNWFNTPGGAGSSDAQISSKLVVRQGFKLWTGSPLS